MRWIIQSVMVLLLLCSYQCYGENNRVWSNDEPINQKDGGVTNEPDNPVTNGERAINKSVEISSIDARFNKCLDAIAKDVVPNLDTSALSTVFMIDSQEGCIIQATIDWDMELNKWYKKYLETLNDKQRSDIRNAQRAWIKYRDNEIKAINSVFDGKWGTATLYRASSIMGLTKSKAIELREAYLAKVDDRY